MGKEFIQEVDIPVDKMTPDDEKEQNKTQNKQKESKPRIIRRMQTSPQLKKEHYEVI